MFINLNATKIYSIPYLLNIIDYEARKLDFEIINKAFNCLKEDKMSSPKKNFIYNLIYQMLVFIIPLITAPYLARVVGAKGVGIYSYTYSIVYYFMLLTLLGVNNYGNRSIAKVRDNKKELSKTFWSIYLFQLLMGIIMLIAYVGYICLFDIKYKNIAIIQTLFVLSAILDVNWFFFGMEEFKKTITRNTFVKLGNILLIFLLVKGKNDLWKYTLIMSGMTCLSQLILWGFLKKKISFVPINKKDIIKHIKSNLILFIPVVAVSLYKMMDKVMLGAMTSVTEVGYYENAEKIINMPMTLVTALGTVMLPRISNIIAKGELSKVEQYIKKSIKFVMFVSFIMCFGLIGISYHFAPFYFGKEFQKTGILMIMLATTLPFLSFANVLRTQYLIPKEKDKIYIISVSLGALTNLILNFIFISRLKSIGACIGTIAAEVSVMLYQTFAVRKELPVGKYIKEVFPFFIKGIIMLLCIYPLNNINLSPIIRLLLQVLIGGSIYCILNIKYILSVIDLNKVLKKLGVKKNKYVLEDIDNDGSLDVISIPTIKTDNIISSNSINEEEFILPKEDIILKEEIYTDRESLSNAIRNDNSYIKNIDFNYHYNFDIIDLILEEIKIYNYKFNNEDYLRDGKYPIILSNNHSFMKYVIDKDFNNIFYVDSFNMDKNEINGIINYTFKKVYLLKEKDKNITFNCDKFKDSNMMSNSYFIECLKYIK